MGRKDMKKQSLGAGFKRTNEWVPEQGAGDGGMWQV